MNEENILSSVREFAGFIDGFRARNLASIQQKIKVQLSEMETRLVLLQSLTQSIHNSAAFATALSLVDTAFHNGSVSIIERLSNTSDRLNTLLAEQFEFIKNNPPIYAQVKAFLYAYVDAADVSRAPNLVDAAVALAKTYEALFSAPEPQEPTMTPAEA